jgi:hypothetical protein
MSTLEQTLGGPEIEVVAKATRRRFTLEFKRKIVREDDGRRRTAGQRRAFAEFRTLASDRWRVRPDRENYPVIRVATVSSSGFLRSPGGNVDVCRFSIADRPVNFPGGSSGGPAIRKMGKPPDCESAGRG